MFPRLRTVARESTRCVYIRYRRTRSNRDAVADETLFKFILELMKNVYYTRCAALGESLSGNNKLDHEGQDWGTQELQSIFGLFIPRPYFKSFIKAHGPSSYPTGQLYSRKKICCICCFIDFHDIYLSVEQTFISHGNKRLDEFNYISNVDSNELHYFNRIESGEYTPSSGR